MSKSKQHKYLIAAFLAGAIALSSAIIISLVRFGKHRPKKTSTKAEVLLISLKSSGGHMSAARAIKTKLEEYGYQSDIAALDDYDPLMLGSGYETAMASKIGRVALTGFLSKIYWQTGSYYMNLFYQFLKHWLDKGNYKCVVSVMCLTYRLIDYTLTGYGYKIPFIIIPTDWEDPALGNGFWIDGPNALYLLGTDRLWEQCPSEYQKRKIDGMILRPEFMEDIKSKEERCEELRLPKDKPIIMIMFGKCASSEMVNVALSMKDSKQYHFVFLCGSNKRFKESIEKVKDAFNCEHYTVYGFLDNPHRVMQASDIFIGKPGPGALSEAMCYEMPILYSKDMILDQEKYNANRVEELGIGIGFMDTQELVTLVPKVINGIDKFKEAYKKVPKNNALNQVCEVIKETIKKHN